MESDIDILGEYLKSYLQDLLGSGDNQLEYEYDFEEELGTFTGRKISIMPLEYGTGEPTTRGEDTYDLTIGVIVRKRYEQPAEQNKAVPTEWVKDEVGFVESEIFNPLSDARIMHEVPGSGGEQYWAQFAEVAVVYNYARLTRDKVFWSELKFTYRKLKA